MHKLTITGKHPLYQNIVSFSYRGNGYYYNKKLDQITTFNYCSGGTGRRKLKQVSNNEIKEALKIALENYDTF